MGVFKWLRRERITVTTGHVTPPTPTQDDQPNPGTIRTEEYKRDLAEFQARRSGGSKDLQETPVKKKCGRHSLPVSCTDCTGDPDTTFNYEKKSAMKYKKKTQNKRERNAHSEERAYEGVPNVQFLFQNQVFMPGNMYGASFSEPRKSNKRYPRQRSPDFQVQKQIDFKDEQSSSPPLFFKNNSLHFNTKEFLSEHEEVDGLNAAGDVKTSSQSSGSQKNDSCEEKLWEVMSELKHFDQWADEQLQAPFVNTSKSDDSKSDTSAFGLPIASACNLNVTLEKNKIWSRGAWGVVPVQLKRLAGVTVDRVRKKQSLEINILRKCRHPNIILLMGLYPDVQNNIHIICERCSDSLFGILHVQGRILSAQTSVHYALDIANALVFLRMHGFVHTELSSMSVMITAHDTAKLADVAPCVPLPTNTKQANKRYDAYSPEPLYVNLTDTRDSTAESEPLISQRSSEAYLSANAVPKHYKAYSESEHYRWQAPELFSADADGLVYPCSKSDVYSLCIMLWECCNAVLPWKSLSYDKLKELYTLWKIGVSLPQDGTYPGSLLSLLQQGLTLQRDQRIDLASLQSTLLAVQQNLDQMEYIIIPARLSKKKSSFSTQPWDTTSPTDSDCVSPKNIQHKADIHTRGSSTSTDSEKDTKTLSYEIIHQANQFNSFTTDKCFVSDEEIPDNIPIPKYEHLQDKDFSSACSTPIAKLRARIKDIESPGTLHRTDSTEYCSILSPDARKFSLMDESSKDQSAERSSAKFSRSFTPKSYKPLHIKVPECNLDSIKNVLKEQNGLERSSYNFDIKNYSLPTTPIARSNKLRKNAWLSGDLNLNKVDTVDTKDQKNESVKAPSTEGTETQKPEPVSKHQVLEKENKSEGFSSNEIDRKESLSCESINTMTTLRDSFTGLRRIIDPPHDFSPDTIDPPVLERARSLNCMKNIGVTKYKVEEEVLANVNVKPLVAIHEKWIYEASKKTGRSLSLPEDNRSTVTAVKPASHCVDTLQKSLPQLNVRRPSVGKTIRHQPAPTGGKNGSHWEQFCLAREAISKSMKFHQQDHFESKKASEKGTITEDINKDSMVDRSTDTLSIEEFIKDLIRKEFQHLISEMSDNTSESTASCPKGDDLLNKGVANIVESLKNDDEAKKESIKSFSRIKINGNNKPLLQITFNRTGENSLQVLDNCVNVTICDPTSGLGSGRDKLNLSVEDTMSPEEIHINTLKRCQAFNAIQEARSTEDLYIDDDLSTHMQENFGGKVKLIPLHGSLHEILCEREDDCCLLKVKQENGCDTIYFRCDNSDTESKDAIDGTERSKDTVVFKRSISLIEERIQRVLPKDKRPNPAAALKRLTDKLKARPKSEIYTKTLSKETRALSNSSPSLSTNDAKTDEVELNIESVMCYQDSSSDECLKCQTDNDDFETLEREIEEDMANNHSSLTCGSLAKISEENLSAINDDTTDEN
ncbi:uncharacterized protein LOC123874601 isoform X2 [Maniola jurtina]|uniref:uncharacterized protein LOC123874601 isoform X2 n=1 Tax=Maniola jurtina TaxID=191418 RepID=UPI001E68E835|nr:uncharacterized protein LOC123874601 isoform X2 [Maniola jurtina]